MCEREREISRAPRRFYIRFEMSQQRDTGVNQSGSISQDAGTISPRNGKRCRDQSEEEVCLTTLGMADQCVKPRNLGDILLSGDGKNSTDNHTFSVTEKRFKCGPSDSERHTPISTPGMLVANVDKIAEGHTSGIEGATQFRCDICSVKSSSAKDLGTHLSGKKHAKRRELVSGIATPDLVKGVSITKRSGGGPKAKLFAQEIQASVENTSTHSNATQPVISMGQQVLVDGSNKSANQATEGHVSSCTAGTDVEVVDFQASISKCPELNNAVAVGQHTSIDRPFMEPLVNQVLKNESLSRVALNDFDVTNGTVNNLTSADDLAKESNQRIILESQPTKSFMASVSTKSNSDCVAQALASALSAHACPEDLQKGSSCGQAAGCSDSQVAGAISADSHGMVNMHSHCFLNLLHDVRVSAIEDLFRHAVGVEKNGGLATKTWPPIAAAVSTSASDVETVDLNCTVCRVEYGSKADLDLHLAGKRHTSLVRRLGSRCQLCNINCNSEKEFITHLSGRKHASKLRLIQKRVTF